MTSLKYCCYPLPEPPQLGGCRSASVRPAVVRVSAISESGVYGLIYTDRATAPAWARHWPMRFRSACYDHAIVEDGLYINRDVAVCLLNQPELITRVGASS